MKIKTYLGSDCYYLTKKKIFVDENKYEYHWFAEYVSFLEDSIQTYFEVKFLESIDKMKPFYTFLN